MKHSPINSYFNVYRLITVRKENLCVAISKKFEVEIEKLIEEYGSLENTPIDKTVRGIFLECNYENTYNFDSEKQENDITVNQLRPYISE